MGNRSLSYPLADPETIRFVKQSYQLEDIRVLTYDRLRNMMGLVLAASYFAAVYLGVRAKMEILVTHVLKASKRIFVFLTSGIMQ